MFTREDISSLPVADSKFQEAKSYYLGQLIVTPEMVAKKINDNKSPGVDGTPPKLLMETVEQIIVPLARVFNLSLKEGVVPVEWKEANTIPLSLTPVICKLLERLIKHHMMDFLVRHNLLNPFQHGFLKPDFLVRYNLLNPCQHGLLKARSCLTNMLCFLEEITKWLDEGSPVNYILRFSEIFLQSVTSKITTTTN